MPITITIEGRDSLEFDINLRSFVEQHFGVRLDETPAPVKETEKAPRIERKPPIVVGEDEEVDAPAEGSSFFDLPGEAAKEKPAAKRGRPRKNVAIDEESARRVAAEQAANDEELPEEVTLPGGQVVEVMDPNSPTMGDCIAAFELVLQTAGEEGIQRVLSVFDVERVRNVPPAEYPRFIAQCKKVVKQARM